MVGFVVADFCVFGVTIVISLGIGIYYALSGGQQKTTSEYLVGNRQMKILPVALSLMVSFESSIMMLGFPAETYVYGMMFWLSTFGFMFALMLAVRMVVPLVHPLKLTSVYEYIELRFKSTHVRRLCTVMGILNYVFYMAIVLFGPGIALEAVTDFPMWASVLVVAAASIVYTSIGGIKAVIWTDVFQSLIMFMGIFAILIKGTLVAGGASNVFKINAASGRLDIFNFDPDPTVRHTFWCLVIGGSIRMIGLNFNQSTIQRISATPKQRDANKVLFFTGPAFFLTLSLATLEGLVAYAYFSTKRCDPLASGEITNPNQVIPYMVLDIFRNLPGMPGLFMASLFSASLSTLSSGLSSLSALTVQDLVKPNMKNLSEARATMIAKLSVIVYGLMSVGGSFLIAKVKGPMSQITSSILSSFGGPMTGIFILAIFCPWATSKGAITGGIIGIVLTFWISMGSNFSKTLKKTPWLPLAPTDMCYPLTNDTGLSMTTMNVNATNLYMSSITTLTPSPETMVLGEPQGLDKLYSLSYQWFGVVGIIVTMVIGIIVSLALDTYDPEKVDVRYVLPFFDQLFPCLPERIRKFLRFGVKFEKREQLLREMDTGVFDYEMKIPDAEDGEKTTELSPLANGKSMDNKLDMKE